MRTVVKKIAKTKRVTKKGKMTKVKPHLRRVRKK